MLRSITLLATLIAVLSCTSMAAHADIIVSISNLSLTAGGSSGFVDVEAVWSGPPATVNVLAMASAFDITPVTPAPGSNVTFVRYAPDDDNGDHHYGNAAYLFDGNSANLAAMPIAHAGVVFNSDLSFLGGDGIADPLAPVPIYAVLGNTARLLYRFELIATGTPVGIELFNLTLDPTSSFLDDGINSIAFSATPGTISVSSLAAVPEPSAIGLVMAVSLGVITRRVRRRFAKSLNS